MKLQPTLLCFFTLTATNSLSAASVTNISAQQIFGSYDVEVTYDLSLPIGQLHTDITLEMSDDGGSTYNVPVDSARGDVGAGVTPGKGKKITWPAGEDWLNQFSNQMLAKITANDSLYVVSGVSNDFDVPNGFVLIPDQEFQMGDASNPQEGKDSERPLAMVTVSDFYVMKTELTWIQWQEVQDWSLANNYHIAAGKGDGDLHPVHSISWYDAVKWCNAASERDGLKPCYYTDPVLTQVYRQDNLDPEVDWNANGYRLPTEAEWEKAARGGIKGKRFPWGDSYPWGDTISHARANYKSSSETYEPTPYGDESNNSGYHPTYQNGRNEQDVTNTGIGFTAPVGSFPDAYGYGLRDMVGNVSEWCWDWHDEDYYRNINNTTDPKGSASGKERTVRGGNFMENAHFSRCARRNSETPYYEGLGTGIRLAKSHVSPLPSSPVTLTPPLADYLVEIPAGEFEMGDDASSNAPKVNVTISAFNIMRTEVTLELWQEVRQWGIDNGHVNENVINEGKGKSGNHPVHSVSWLDIVNWCNLASLRDGLIPCYDLTAVPITCEWSPHGYGYRLPTEAEWEKAARGGIGIDDFDAKVPYDNKPYPWGDTIDHAKANYKDSANGHHPAYATGVEPHTAPVGSFAANGYSLHDMAGNLREFCWDIGITYPYVDDSTDPRGSDDPINLRITRGGSWDSNEDHARCARRSVYGTRNDSVGFRIAQSAYESTSEDIVVTYPTNYPQDILVNHVKPSSDRNRTLNVRIRYPKDFTGEARVILMSHGGAGTDHGFDFIKENGKDVFKDTEEGYKKFDHLGDGLASRGYVCVHIGHRSSRTYDVDPEDILDPNTKKFIKTDFDDDGTDEVNGVDWNENDKNLQYDVLNPKDNTIHYWDRPSDVAAVIVDLSSRQLADFKGTLKLDEIGHIGYSWGASTAAVVNGSKLINVFEKPTYNFRSASNDLQRVKASVQLSAGGWGSNPYEDQYETVGDLGLPSLDNSWRDVDIPTLNIFGEAEADGHFSIGGEWSAGSYDFGYDDPTIVVIAGTEPLPNPATSGQVLAGAFEKVDASNTPFNNSNNIVEVFSGAKGANKYIGTVFAGNTAGPSNSEQYIVYDNAADKWLWQWVDPNNINDIRIIAEAPASTLKPKWVPNSWTTNTIDFTGLPAILDIATHQANGTFRGYDYRQFSFMRFPGDGTRDQAILPGATHGKLGDNGDPNQKRYMAVNARVFFDVYLRDMKHIRNRIGLEGIESIPGIEHRRR